MKRFLTILFSILLSAVSVFAANPTGTLPIVYINTSNNVAISSKETYVAGNLYIDPRSSEYAALGSSSNPVTAQFKGRGNYTWTGFDKKPYKIKFDVKQTVLGMPNNRHWCLLACADDYLGFLKMPAGFIVSEAVGLRWTPRQVPVELVLNGSYKGLYFLTEHVRIAGNRVKITEQEDNATDSVSGGWLVEIDNYASDGNIEFDEGNGQHVMVSLKEPEVLSSQQRNYIEQQLNGLNNALYGNSSAKLWQMLDVDEAAKYYLVQEIMEDCESYHGSCFLYKDRDRNGKVDKWKFGPVWDFGNAYDRYKYNYTEAFIYVNPSFEQYWIGQLATWPEFQKAVKEQWWIYYHEHKDQVRADIGSYAALLKYAAKNDADLWKNSQNYCNGQGDNSDMEEKLSKFYRRYDWRIQWLYSQWGEGTRPATWDVEQTQEKPSLGRKVLHDGHILIECNGQFYNLLGQPVSH